jgi:dTDP-4-dehydrorhamnose 3,5-epimerase
MKPLIRESDQISDVLIVELGAFADDRGRFTEIFRKEWFPEVEWNMVQSNRSDSSSGVLRGLHYHHKQVDYWYVTKGAIRAGLVDLRKSSPTFRASQNIDLNERSDMGLLIPTGVAHGFFTITEATLFYIVDQYYDGDDEFGVLWNDPEIGIDWGAITPVLSPRDQNNRKLADIPTKDLPS